ncbi:hypothetical protein L7F22_053745 [Adiantum nelumboides]|nr:hypothetical protein [Adiantum nelumboides]
MTDDSVIQAFLDMLDKEHVDASSLDNQEMHVADMPCQLEMPIAWDIYVDACFVELARSTSIALAFGGLMCEMLILRPDIAAAVGAFAAGLISGSVIDHGIRHGGVLQKQMVHAKAARDIPIKCIKSVLSKIGLHSDGAYRRQSNKAAGGFIILNEEKKEVLKKGIQLHLAHSNNEAEYATLKAGLEECKSMGIRRLMVKGDTLLIVRQVQGTWACKNSKLLQWLHEVKLLMKDFEAIQIQHISRQHNKEADNMANSQFEVMVGAIKFKEPLFQGQETMEDILYFLETGPLPRTSIDKQYILTATDYMTRWAKAASVARITAADVSKFVLDYICSRFGTPLEILSDRGPEKTNGVLCKIITKHVRDRPQDWDKHLTAALWAYRTSFKVSTQFTPYHLVYGQEALLPIEVELGSLRVLARETTSSKEKLEQRILDLQRLEIDREAATDYYITQAYKKREEFNNKVKEKKLEEGMLILRYDSRLDLSHSKKFLQRWEGPYVIFKKFKNGSYRLQGLSRKIHKYPVNGWRLKEFFQRIQPIKEERQVSLDA